jgi:DNA-binding FadR family transcriptional regulator
MEQVRMPALKPVKVGRFGEPVQPSTGNITVDLVNLMGRDIVSGRIPPGAILPKEEDMTSHFAVSRTAVREATKMLAAKGLVDSRPRRGTQVRQVKDWNLLDSSILSWLRQVPADRRIIIELLEMRLGIEPEASALAARRADAAQIDRIRAALEMMVESASGITDPVEADCQYHEAILVATGNRFYQPFANLVRTALSLTAPVTNALYGHSIGNVGAHEDIFRAIRAGDDAEASKLMRSMLRDLVQEVTRAEVLPLRE